MFRRIIIVFILLIFFKAFSYSTSLVDVDGRVIIDDIRVLCGANSVYIAAKMLGHDVQYLDIYKKLYPQENSLVSIADIENNLDYLGIRHETLKMTWGEISKHADIVFILYTYPPEDMKIGHFKVIKVFSNGVLRVFDAPHKPYNLHLSGLDASDRQVVIALGDNFKMSKKFPYMAVLGVSLIFCGILIIIVKRKN